MLAATDQPGPGLAPTKVRAFLDFIQFSGARAAAQQRRLRKSLLTRKKRPSSPAAMTRR
jgi:hypothetical protein